MLELLVLWIRDLPNPDVPMDSPLLILFRVLGFTPRVPSRWTVRVVSRFCDLQRQSFCQLENSGCRNVDGFLDVHHVSKQMDGSDLIAIS
jgi:hypothetical protein